MRRPDLDAYDVVIIGGAMYGASIAWFLVSHCAFDGRVLVVERDISYAFAATSHTNSCMRQQFSQKINIQISQFAADYIKHFKDHMGDDERVPEIPMHSFGYLYLATDREFARALKHNQTLQAACGAGTRIMTAADIERDYPFYRLDDVILGSHNKQDEGYFDGNTVFQWWKRLARENGVEFIHNEVVGLTLSAGGNRVESIQLSTGEKISCATVVNATGTRAAMTGALAGIQLPVEPRKRYTFVFKAQKPLDKDLPLTIDPSGVHVRTDGVYYMAGCPPDHDAAVAPDDFEPDHRLWENKAWPAIANRIPQFEAIKLIQSWVGHYDYNTFDQNAIIGPHPVVENFIFANGFSGHGLQQAPALGRGIAEWITYGEYRSLDLAPFGFDRLIGNRRFTEDAVI